MKCFITFLLVMVALPIAAKPAQDKFALILDSIYQCYNDENKIGTDLAQCTLAKVKNTPNPDEYRVDIVDDNPSKTVASNITITIYNKFGQVFVCKGIAQEKITIQECTGKKVPDLTPGQEMSITPP